MDGDPLVREITTSKQQLEIFPTFISETVAGVSDYEGLDMFKVGGKIPCW